METEKNEKAQRFMQTKTALLLMVFVLILVLMIPLYLVQGIIKEREYRQHEVIHEISEKWGEEIVLYGPILKVPYKVYTESEQFNNDTKETIKIRKSSLQYAYFFPEELKKEITVKNEPLYRGNYQTVVFNAKIDVAASYDDLDFSKNDINSEDVLWDKATILIKTTNLKSIQEEVFLRLNKQKHQLEPIFETDYSSLHTLQTQSIDLSNLKGKKDISFTLDFNGSKSIKTIPIGKTSTTNITSNWADPSFSGNFLPNSDSKEINADGFKADWKILHVNRAFGQSHFRSLPNLNAFSYGVDFKLLNDDYQQNERASKYGVLVISLTFLVFFMLQAINNLKVHIIQYALIGAALVIFYSLLISITEHSSFTFAYLISSAAVITMISLYAWSFFKRLPHVALITSSLTALYVFIYVIIQLDNYALLVGSVGLFIILGVIMYLSRKVNWNAS